ncbi:unnamed protein product [Rotaria sordida]|uniref:Uncharacterized protein n=1 Tax=Rotaria sordida TaxID=392033 RepID=A0A813N0X9_9BILA|nr:unnamed protein product [Rotaria sordida]CAF0746851.1 unnamed protein product [Rotaria sordida]
MVLYYGLLALETANNTIAAAASAQTTTTTTTTPGLTSDRISRSRKQKYLSNSIGKIPSSSLSSSNSWIYTEDLRKRFEERYADCRYVFIPVYIDRKSTKHSHSTTTILSQNDHENSWIYSRSLRDHLVYSTSKISLPLTTNISSSSSCCVTNHGFMRDELPIKKTSKIKLFKHSSSTKDKSTTNLSLPSLRFSPFTSSISSFSTTNNLIKHRTSDVVEEEDDEGIDDENHSAPLIKHDSMVPSSLSTSRTVAISSTGNNTIINPTTTDASALSTSISSNTKASIKHPAKPNNKLTRLRSFFFKSFSPSSSFSRTQQRQQQQQQTTLSSSSLPNRISRT